MTVGAEIGTFIWSVLCIHPSPIPPFLAIFNTHKVDNHDDCNSFLEKRLDLVSLFSCDITSSISWSFCCNALSYSASCWQLCQICCYPFLFRFERFLHLFVSAHHRSSYWTWLPFHLRVVILWQVPPAFVLAHCVNRPGYGPVGSTAQIYCQDSTISTHQVCEYPDSTISKEWQMIMTLNRKLLEKQREEPLCFIWGAHRSIFFTMSMVLLVLEIVQPCLHIFGFNNFSLDWQTDKLTDGLNRFLNSFTHVHAGVTSKSIVVNKCGSSTLAPLHSLGHF